MKNFLKKTIDTIVKLVIMFGQYLKRLGQDFVTSIKYKPQRISMILAVLVLSVYGFFLPTHQVAIQQFPTAAGNQAFPIIYDNALLFDLVGFIVFMIFILVTVNAVLTINFVKNVNIKYAIYVTISTLAILVGAIFYLIALIRVSEASSMGYVLPDTIPLIVNSFVIVIIFTVLSILVTISTYLFAIGNKFGQKDDFLAKD